MDEVTALCGPEDPPKVTYDERLDAAEEYLLSLGISHWGRGFGITKEDSRRKAAEFLVSAADGFNEFDPR